LFLILIDSFWTLLLTYDLNQYQMHPLRITHLNLHSEFRFEELGEDSLKMLLVRLAEQISLIMLDAIVYYFVWYLYSKLVPKKFRNESIYYLSLSFLLMTTIFLCL
jgi:hypothetical protein